MRYFKVVIFTDIQNPLLYCNHNGSSRSYDIHNNRLSCEPVSIMLLDDDNKVMNIKPTKDNIAQLTNVLSEKKIPAYDCHDGTIVAIPMTSMIRYNNDDVLMAVIDFYKKSNNSITHQSLLSAMSYDRFMNVDSVLQSLENAGQIESITSINKL